MIKAIYLALSLVLTGAGASAASLQAADPKELRTAEKGRVPRLVEI